MLNAAPAYETYVVDDPDEPGVVPDFEVVVQALVMSRWHRTVVGADETACGVPYRIATTPKRRELLTHRDAPLCADCFTAHELTRAMENDRDALEREMRADEERRKRDEEFFAALKRKRTPTQGDD